MKSREIEFRTDWDDAVWADGVTAVVMPADVIEVHSLGDAG